MSDLFEFLFARPSFTEGLARIFDFGNALNVYNESPTPVEADIYALHADWRVIGWEIRRAQAAVVPDTE